MSALGQKQTCAAQKVMSALPPKADMCSATSGCPLSANSRHLDEHRHFRRRARARRSNICDQAEGLALFRDRAIVANFIFMGDTVRSGLGTCGKAAIMKRKVYANVA